jgi:hypothetical protein
MSKEAIRTYVEANWVSRARGQELKHGTKKYSEAEVNFFAGAIAALQAVYGPDADKLVPEVPMMWVLGPMSGRHIVEKEEFA